MQDIRLILKGKFGDLTEEQLTFGEACYSLGQQNIADFLEDNLKKKEERVAKQKKDFYNELIPFVPEYGKEMIRDFYNHFSQEIQPANRNILRNKPNQGWNTKARLDQWRARNFNGHAVAVKKVEPQVTDRYK